MFAGRKLSNGNDAAKSITSPVSLPPPIADRVQLRLRLPSGHVEHLLCDGRAPVMDVLIGLCATHQLNPADHALVRREKSETHEGGSLIEARSNQFVGAFVGDAMDDADELRLMNRRELAQTRNDSVHFLKKQAQLKNSVQAFDITNRVIVNLPGLKRVVIRMSLKELLSAVHRRLCEEKGFDSTVYQAYHPSTGDVLSLDRSLADYNLNEFSLLPKDWDSASASSTLRSSCSSSQLYDSMSSNPSDAASSRSASFSKRNSGGGLKAFFLKGRKKSKDDSADSSRSASSSASLAGSVSRSPHSAAIYSPGSKSPRTGSMGPMAVGGGYVNSRPQLNSSNGPSIYLPPPGAIKAPPPPPPVSSSSATVPLSSTNTVLQNKTQSTSHKKSRAPLPPSGQGITVSKSSFQLNRNDSPNFAKLHEQSIPTIARSEPSLAALTSNTPPRDSDAVNLAGVPSSPSPPPVGLRTDSLNRPIKKKPPKPPPTSQPVAPDTAAGTSSSEKRLLTAVFIPPPPPSTPPPADLPTAPPPWAITSPAFHQHQVISIEMEDKGVGVTSSDLDSSCQSSESDVCTLEELNADLEDMIVLGEEHLSAEDQSYKLEVSQFVERMQEMTSAHHERRGSSQEICDEHEIPFLPLPPDISLLLTLENDEQLLDDTLVDETYSKKQSHETPSSTTDKLPSNIPQMESSSTKPLQEAPSSATDKMSFNLPQVESSSTLPLLEALSSATDKMPSDMPQVGSSSTIPLREPPSSATVKMPSNILQVESSSAKLLLEAPFSATGKMSSDISQVESSSTKPLLEALSSATDKMPSNILQVESSSAKLLLEAPYSATDKMHSGIPQVESSTNSGPLSDSSEKTILLLQIEQLEQQLQTWRDQLSRNQELLAATRLNQPISSASSTVLYQQVILQRQMIVQLESSLRILRSQYVAPSEPIMVYNIDKVTELHHTRDPNQDRLDSLVASPKSYGNDEVKQEENSFTKSSITSQKDSVPSATLPSSVAGLTASQKDAVPAAASPSSTASLTASQKDAVLDVTPPSSAMSFTASQKDAVPVTTSPSSSASLTASLKDAVLAATSSSSAASLTTSQKDAVPAAKRSAKDFLVVRKAELPQFIPHRMKESDKPTEPVSQLSSRPSRHSVAVIPSTIQSYRQIEMEFQQSSSARPARVSTDTTADNAKAFGKGSPEFSSRSNLVSLVNPSMTIESSRKSSTGSTEVSFSSQPEKEVHHSISSRPNRLSLVNTSTVNKFITTNNSHLPTKEVHEYSFNGRGPASLQNTSTTTSNTEESNVPKENLPSSSMFDIPRLRRIGLVDKTYFSDRPMSMATASDRVLQQKQGRTIYASQKSLLKTASDAGENLPSSMKSVDSTSSPSAEDETPICGIVSERKAAFTSIPTVAPKPKKPAERSVLIVPKEQQLSAFPENVTLRSIREPARGTGRVISAPKPTPREALMSALRESGGRIARPSSTITVATVELRNGADF